MGCLGTLKSSGMLQGNKSLHMVLRRRKKNTFKPLSDIIPPWVGGGKKDN